MSHSTFSFIDKQTNLSGLTYDICNVLLTVEKECRKVGLVLNAKKTKSVAYNIDDPTPLHTFDGTYLEWKDDFKYLGSWVDNSEKRHQHKESAGLESFEWYDENMEVQYE